MDVPTLMERLGGVATTRELRAHVDARAIAAAVDDESITRVARGRFQLPTADDARAAANHLKGTVALRSAAASWGWRLKDQPEKPEIFVPRGRRVSQESQADYDVRWRRLPSSDIFEWRTSPLRTVLDCATTLPMDEALAVADSALRSGLVRKSELVVAAARLPGRGRVRGEEVAWHANGKAANPFESVIRAISLPVRGLRLEPQVWLEVGGRRVRPDLVDRDLRIVVEGDSHEFHTSRDRIDSDCWRYDELTLADWLVLRVSWVQAMFRQEWVGDVLRRGLDRQQARLRTTVALVRGYEAPPVPPA